MSAFVGMTYQYHVDMADRYDMYSDLIVVAVNLLTYLKSDNFQTPEIKGIEQETTAALCSVIKYCSAILTNLEADTRVSDDVQKKS